jgi:hypothetical protein
MVSLEPWTIRGCGYPDLLASGELCGGEVIHDRQHPHDLVMELAAVYDRPLAGAIRLQSHVPAVIDPRSVRDADLAEHLRSEMQ